MRNLLFAFAVFLGILLSFHLVAAVECGQTPTDHCTISTSTTFTPGTYQVENLTIIANDTVIDCNGAQFNKLNALLFVVDATEGVTIQNCYMSGYARAITGGSNSVPPFPSVLTLTVRDNIFDSVWTAVYLIGRRTVNNTRPADPFPNIQIVNNTITNAVSAIKLINEDNNIITDNTIQVITQASNFEAIVLAGSSNSLLLRNTIDGGKIRIQRDAGKNATNATIEENVISDSPLAIELLQGADGARVRRNIASRVDQGMSISYSSDHYIRANAFSANELIDTVGGGISIEGGNLAQNITIFLNYFENLSDPVFDGGFNNSWDNNITLLGRTFSFGNFYQTFYRDNQTRRGFACVDLDFDNICDNPYLFDVNVRDNFPIRSLSGPDSPGGGGWSENTPVVEPIQPFMISEVGQIHVLIN
ncbi:MAG: NosD domain-containing protein, partial [Candidatus Woesearchaeota archaeon]|nr:NosD domain-containing protein [Candidatus Woesearchaeota archaeon]